MSDSDLKNEQAGPTEQLHTGRSDNDDAMVRLARTEVQIKNLADNQGRYFATKEDLEVLRSQMLKIVITTLLSSMALAVAITFGLIRLFK